MLIKLFKKKKKKKKKSFFLVSVRIGAAPVRRETAEGSSVKFIGYRMPLHEQNDFTVLLFTSHKSTKACQEIPIFRIISHGVHLHNIPRIFLATPTLDADI